MPGKDGQHTQEFRESTVRMVLEQGRTIGEVAKALGLKPRTVKYWIESMRKADARTQALEESALRKRVRELEATNERLTMERDLLKKAAAYFARNQQ
jgi:transposase